MIRVFPQKTSATPVDEKVYFTGPPLQDLNDREVHVSCVFTWDKRKSENLAKLWLEQSYNVTVGGPAYDDQGSEFEPGRYLKNGFVMTSRGCNNKCWFCSVWKREGCVRELEIKDGWRIMDSNLLQCSENHIRRVFAMLQKQKMPVSFLGGLEAKIIKDWHIELLTSIKIAQAYFAYDTADDYEPLVDVSAKLWQAGFTPQSHRISCYILIGYKGDTFEAAVKRIEQVKNLGLVPFAMLYRDDKGQVDYTWRKFQRSNCRPKLIYKRKNNKEIMLFESV